MDRSAAISRGSSAMPFSGRPLVNTAYFSFMEVVLVTLISLGVAMLLNHPLGRSGFFRILLIVPWAIAPVANAVLWKWILNANYGVLNGLLKSLGLIDNYQVWLGTPFSALNFLLIVDVWKSVPFVALLMLAGLQRVPQSLYRAAYMDGAGPWQSFLYVTLADHARRDRRRHRAADHLVAPRVSIWFSS